MDVLRNLGPKAEGLGDNGKEGKWKVQARGLVRTFVARSRDFQDEPEWGRVRTLQNELKKTLISSACGYNTAEVDCMNAR